MDNTIIIFQVDAFTSSLFQGNPAAVCLLDEWLDETLMQSIAQENNLSETAFLVETGGKFEIRWFTPESEVDLCGHATLASAHVLFEHLRYEHEIIFNSFNSGQLNVQKEGEWLTLDFPADKVETATLPKGLEEALGCKAQKVFKGATDYLIILENQQAIESLEPNFHLLKKVDARGVIVSATGNEVDFVSRFFAPQVGINEDPVTGSAHTTLTPYWSGELGKNKLSALQLSKRGGKLECEMAGDRVMISGQAKTYLIGEIVVPNDIR